MFIFHSFVIFKFVCIAISANLVCLGVSIGIFLLYSVYMMCTCILSRLFDY